jgi:hypothetical protein
MYYIGIAVVGLIEGARVVGLAVVGFQLVGLRDVGLRDVGFAVGLRVVGFAVGLRVVGFAVVGFNDVGFLVAHVLIGPDGVGNVVGKLTDTGQILMSSIPASIMSPAASLETIPSEARMRSWRVDPAGIAGYLASIQAALLTTSQMETTGVHAPPLIAISRLK